MPRTLSANSDEVDKALRPQEPQERISSEGKSPRIPVGEVFPASPQGLGDELRNLAAGPDLEGVDFDRDRSGIECAELR